MKEFKTLYQYALSELTDLFGEGEAKAILRILIEDLLGFSPAAIQLQKKQTLTQDQYEKWQNAIDRLKKREPVQYICGKAQFYGMELKVNPHVLIPRPETEELVDYALKLTPNDFKGKVLDIGTGSGCIIISIAKKRPQAHCTALDLSEKALDLARQNAHNHKVDIDFKSLDFLDSDIDKELPVYDVIVSNPPYVAFDEWKKLEPEVKNHEPAMALHPPLALSDLIFYERIAQFSENHLKEGGFLILEINERKAAEVLALFQSPFFINTKILKDISGKDRFLYAEKAGILIA